MARRLLVVLVASAALVSFGGVTAPIGAAVLPVTVGGGTATIGTVHEYDPPPGPDDYCVTTYVTIDGVAMSGALQFGGALYKGQLQLATLHGTGSHCYPYYSPSDCYYNPLCALDTITTPSTVAYAISNAPVALTGHNNAGETVQGSCRGIWYNASFGALDTKCTATLSGAQTRSFVLTITARVFAAHSLGGPVTPFIP